MPEAHEVDLELWRRWSAGGRKKEALNPLLLQFKPLVDKQVAVFRRTNIPDSAIRARAQLNLIDAFETFDPNRGVRLNSFANLHQKKLLRFVTAHQNFAKIPEPMVYRIAEFKMAEQDLADKLNRDPSVMEMADKLKWPAKHVENMRKVQRQDLSATMFEVDPKLMQKSRWQEISALLPFELDGPSGKIFEETLKSKRPLTTQDLVARLGLSSSQINRSRKQIGATISRYMDV